MFRADQVRVANQKHTREEESAEDPYFARNPLGLILPLVIAAFASLLCFPGCATMKAITKNPQPSEETAIIRSSMPGFNFGLGPTLAKVDGKRIAFNRKVEVFPGNHTILVQVYSIENSLNNILPTSKEISIYVKAGYVYTVYGTPGNDDPDVWYTEEKVFDTPIEESEQKKTADGDKGSILSNIVNFKRTLLNRVVHAGDIVGVKKRLSLGDNINGKTDSLWSPLHVACAANALDIAQLLITHGCDVNIQGARGLTPLHLVAENGNIVLAELLLQNGAQVDAKAEQGVTALFIAAKKGYLDIVNLLIAHGADTRTQDEGQCTVLHMAAFSGNPAIVKLMITLGLPVNARDSSNQTPLHFAAYGKDQDVILLLLENNADIDSRDEQGQTALLNASGLGTTSIIKTLASRGANINAASKKGLTPLLAALLNGHRDTARYLIESGSEVTGLAFSNGTPLYYAAVLGDIEIVKLLLECGVDINEQKSEQHMTPLIIAALFSNPEVYLLVKETFLEMGLGLKVFTNFSAENYIHIIELLLAHGADVTVTANSGMTFLHALCAVRQNALVIKALAKGADVNRPMPSNGWTALHIAVDAQNIDLVKILWDSGADIFAKDQEGRTPLMIAKDKGEGEFYKEFKKIIQHPRNNGYAEKGRTNDTIQH